MILQNKTYLVLTNNLTSLIAATIDSALIAGGNIVIVTSKKEVQKAIADNVGLPSFLVDIPPSSDNRLFFDRHMPGSLEDLRVENYELWKGLSIDRLRFWQVNSDLLAKFISNINFDTVVVDFDLMSLLSPVWDSLDKPFILVKNRTLRTPEHYLFMVKNKSKIELVVTDKEMDGEYLESIGVKTAVLEAEKPFEPPTEKVYGEKVIYYDKRYIWQFNEYVERYGWFQPVSYDNRSIELFTKCHGFKSGILPVKTVKTPEQLIMFTYDEEVIDAMKPKEVLIYDPYQVNMAKETAVGDERVFIL